MPNLIDLKVPVFRAEGLPVEDGGPIRAHAGGEMAW
jgi:hypothetical protein